VEDVMEKMTQKERAWDTLVSIFVETGRGADPREVAKRSGLTESQARRALRSMAPTQVSIRFTAAVNPRNNTRCWKAVPQGPALAAEIQRVR
jgi:hypothetical protein